MRPCVWWYGLCHTVFSDVYEVCVSGVWCMQRWFSDVCEILCVVYLCDIVLNIVYVGTLC